MILVDTGYFLAVAQPRDALHARANQWAGAVSGPFIVTDYILWETVNALSALPDRPKAHALLRHVRESGAYTVVPASTGLTDAGLKLHAERPDKSWSLTDCISFLVMTERGVKQALAHDAHFEQAGFEALLRRDPP
jgi:predicted nucleic acid-binding protein